MPWYLDTALRLVGHFVNLLGGTISFSAVQHQIQQGVPVGVRIAWAGGSAHFVAIGGWTIDPQGGQIVDVFDPWAGTDRQVDYADLVGAYQSPGDTWTDTYLMTGNALVAGGAPSISSSPISA